MVAHNDYEWLCQKIEEFNPEAARILREEAPNFVDFHPTKRLSSAFPWSVTPQRFAYWEDIHYEMIARIHSEARCCGTQQ